MNTENHIYLAGKNGPQQVDICELCWGPLADDMDRDKGVCGNCRRKQEGMYMIHIYNSFCNGYDHPDFDYRAYRRGLGRCHICGARLIPHCNISEGSSLLKIMRSSNMFKKQKEG